MRPVHGGYRFAFFDRDPEPGDLFLRHDVDLSLDAAVGMAELEADAGATATYLLMTRERLLQPRLGRGRGRDRAPARARPPASGSTPPSRTSSSTTRFDPVLAWHNPEPRSCTSRSTAPSNAMEPRFFSPEHYRSDSNQHWRHGCPHAELRGRSTGSSS